LAWTTLSPFFSSQERVIEERDDSQKLKGFWSRIRARARTQTQCLIRVYGTDKMMYDLAAFENKEIIPRLKAIIEKG
jgi:hypothetical protein